MKVLSLLQPWASLVISGAKKFEVRSWQTAYRGPLLIHASARKPTRREKLFFEKAAWFNQHLENMDWLNYGAIIGQVLLKDIFSTEWLLQNWEHQSINNWQQELAFDDYSARRFAWKLEQPIPLLYPLPLKGTLGLWNYEGSFTLAPID